MIEIDVCTIFGGIMLFVGIIFTLVSVLIRNVRKKHNNEWITTQALLINFLRKSNDDHNGYTYFPVFQFEIEGKTIQAQGGFNIC